MNAQPQTDPTAEQMEEVDPLAAHWGRRIAETRGELGWTQDQLSEQSKVSQQAISRIEHGQFRPRDELRLALARALGRRAEDLFSIPPEIATAWQANRTDADDGGER